MEILNTIPGSVDAFGTFVGVITGLLAIVLLCAAIAAFYDSEFGIGLLALLVVTATGLFSYVAISESIVKSPTQYEVRITDYNVIYEKGYEIIEKRGDIHVIQKSEAK
ncbi:hypothetical protein [Cytobacillus massiliigabonensis]|uniref:hypothetical protein n=1 Tax=Cytobacillus massiliigabonensis TaxID=1871011 RepID=UPI000C856504|nr:hypothetical protein [Cytobacillus massiliigabonensis]